MDVPATTDCNVPPPYIRAVKYIVSDESVLTYGDPNVMYNVLLFVVPKVKSSTGY